MTETLKCNAGHSWSREVTSGRKPVWCPEHRPVVAKPAERRAKAPTPVVEETKAEPAPLRINLSKEVTAKVDEALANSDGNPETKFKLRYIQKTLRNPGRRTQADINMLIDTRSRLLAKG